MGRKIHKKLIYKNNFINEIHDINKQYNQCTFSEYINYNIYADDLQKLEKTRILINKYYEQINYVKYFINSLIYSISMSNLKLKLSFKIWRKSMKV
mgnify:CR=1 FL=1